MKHFFRGFTALFAGVLLVIGLLGRGIPDAVYNIYDSPVCIRSMPGIKLQEKQAGTPTSTYTASLLGVLPVKEVAVTHTRERQVLVSGRPFGIKMFCDGVMVVGFADILTATGYQNPAKVSGLKAGDIIIAMDGRAVQTNEEVAQIIGDSGGRQIAVDYMRGDRRRKTALCPVTEASTGLLRSGMWVRDSCAGVGTMTFYDPATGSFAGLGHGIKDVDTSQEIRLLSGEIVPVKISGITKSKNGTAGQLKGTFTQTKATGQILSNGSNGVYGRYFGSPEGQLMQVATPGEVVCGRAQILTTIQGSTPQLYDIQIEKLLLNGTNPVKNMVVRITDSRLLSLAGGIVRGMSGSPVIQDGKLVGAITHVFVNQVDRGYGIFAWNMLTTADSLPQTPRTNAG